METAAIGKILAIGGWIWFSGFLMMMLYYTIGWIRIKRFVPYPESRPVHRFSIVIPARNESACIETCLRDIALQEYPPEMFEIIVMDDFSDDDTVDKVNRFAGGCNIRIRVCKLSEMDTDVSFKKAAVSEGVKLADFEHIILTDADCTRNSNWLKTIDAFMQVNDSDMIYAPVVMKPGSFFADLQTIEFAGLVEIGASAIQWKKPVMCSAANLMFRKDIFMKLGGYRDDQNVVTGDDSFLMFKFFKNNPEGLQFLKSQDAVVSTLPSKTIGEFAHQRRRWVSQSHANDGLLVFLALGFVYLAHLILMLNLIFRPETGMWMLGVKFLVDLMFIFPVLHFFKIKRYGLWLPVAGILQSCYILIIGLWSTFGSFRWKGRKINQ